MQRAQVTGSDDHSHGEETSSKKAQSAAADASTSEAMASAKILACGAVLCDEGAGGGA
jgi:hypothetical protein